MITKKHTLLYLFFLLVFIQGCNLVEVVFEAGMWTGIFIVVAILVLLIFLGVKLFKKMKS